MQQRDLVISSAKKALKNGFITKKQHAKFVSAAKSNYVASWSAVWTIPSVVKDCDEAQTCVKVSLQGVISDFVSKSEVLRQLGIDLSARVKKAGGVKFAKSIAKKSNALHKQNVGETKTLPTTNTECF